MIGMPFENECLHFTHQIIRSMKKLTAKIALVSKVSLALILLAFLGLKSKAKGADLSTQAKPKACPTVCVPVK